MIRIYLDWNVIGNLKQPEFQEIFSFLKANRDVLLFPYSPAHFTDLMKSYSPDNNLFYQDLETLELLCGKHLMRWEGEDGVRPLFGTPKEYFDGEKNKENLFEIMDMEKIFHDLDDSTVELGLGKLGELLKSIYQMQPAGIEITPENHDTLKKFFPNLKEISSIWDLMKDVGPFTQKLLHDREYYKDLRKTIEEQGMKIEANSGNWNLDDVIWKIDEFLKKKGTNLKYLDLVKSSLEYKKEKVTQYEYYTSAYLMLDMFGYKMDKLPKPTDNMQNIQADAEHSFYGGHCDFLVTLDSKMRTKSKVLYNEFNISTVILEPGELISTISKQIHKFNTQTNFLNEAISYCKDEYLVEHHPITENQDYEVRAYKLPIFYCNYFNYVILSNYPSQEGFILTFRKAFSNFSKFIYYTEAEKVINTITSHFGYENMDELIIKKHAMVYHNNDIEAIVDWAFDGGLIRLECEEDTKRPTLSYIISTKNKND
jgi:hypothetical protein